MDIQKDEAFEVYFKTTEIYKREVRIRKADILLFSENFGYFNIVANEALHLWKEAKAQAVPEGFVLVPKSEIGHYYYDESEGMYIDEPDHFLTDLDIGEAQEVKCRDYFDLPSKYAAKIWDENNQDVGTWGIFDTEAEANNVAAHCKAMIEAQEQSHD